MTDDGIKKARSIKLMRWGIVIIILLIVILAVKLRVTDIQVLGNETYTAEEAVDMIFSDYWDKNTAVILIKNLAKQKKDLPFVEDYKIVLKSPTSCELRFYEKKPVGCISYMSSFMYFDREGRVIESSSKRLEGVPLVKGLDLGYVVLGQPLPVSSSLILGSVTGVTQQLDLYDIESDSIYYNDNDNTISVTLAGGDIEVDLGADTEIAAKISVLNDMLPEIREQGLSGILDLSTYTDSEKGSVSSFKVKTLEK